MMSITKCFSVMVASGNGQRCNEFREALRANLYEIDPETNKYRIAIWKYGKQTEPEAYLRISRDVAAIVGPLLRDIDDHYFSVDHPGQKRASQ